jgi:hypothetical protein
MPDRQLCFRCIEKDKCELFQKWQELLELTEAARQELRNRADKSKTETEEVEAIEERDNISQEYWKVRNILRQEAIIRGCQTVLEKMQ